MNAKSLIAFLFVSVPLLAWSQAFEKFSWIDELDFDRDGVPEVFTSVTVDPAREDGLWTVFFSLSGSNIFSQTFVLRPSENRLSISLGAGIPGQLESFTNDFGGGGGSILLFYRWIVDTSCYCNTNYGTVSGDLRFVTNALVGIRFQSSDGPHYAWVQLSRPRVDDGLIFRITDHAWNPAAEEPIRAGLPPELPAPAILPVPGGVRLSWPAKWWRLRLQQNPNPSNASNWTDVPGVVDQAVTLPSPDATGFFRLYLP